MVSGRRTAEAVLSETTPNKMLVFMFPPVHRVRLRKEAVGSLVRLAGRFARPSGQVG